MKFPIGSNTQANPIEAGDNPVVVASCEKQELDSMLRQANESTVRRGVVGGEFYWCRYFSKCRPRQQVYRSDKSRQTVRIGNGRSHRGKTIVTSLGRWCAVIVCVLFVSMARTAIAQSFEEKTFRDLVITQVTRYPDLQVLDLYKFVYQAAVGSAHYIPSEDAAYSYLYQEIKNLQPGPTSEPMIEQLSPDGRLVRVNLRPYLIAGRSPKVLLDAFIRTANDNHGGVARLRQLWGYVESIAAQGALPFQREELSAFFAKATSLGYPPMSHTPVYKSLYRPAYRVVVREYIE